MDFCGTSPELTSLRHLGVFERECSRRTTEHPRPRTSLMITPIVARSRSAVRAASAQARPLPAGPRIRKRFKF